MYIIPCIFTDVIDNNWNKETVIECSAINYNFDNDCYEFTTANRKIVQGYANFYDISIKDLVADPQLKPITKDQLLETMQFLLLNSQTFFYTK